MKKIKKDNRVMIDRIGFKFHGIINYKDQGIVIKTDYRDKFTPILVKFDVGQTIWINNNDLVII